MPSTTHRTHHHLPRAAPSPRAAASLAVVSCDTGFRVAAQVAATSPTARVRVVPTATVTRMSAPEDQAVPPTVRKAAAWTWRLLLFFAALVAVLWMAQHLEVILVPVALALLLSALLLPGVDWLARRRVPRGAAVFVLLLSGVAVIGGILAFVVTQFV